MAPAHALYAQWMRVRNREGPVLARACAHDWMVVCASINDRVLATHQRTTLLLPLSLSPHLCGIFFCVHAPKCQAELNGQHKTVGHTMLRGTNMQQPPPPPPRPQSDASDSAHRAPLPLADRSQNLPPGWKAVRCCMDDRQLQLSSMALRLLQCTR